MIINNENGKKHIERDELNYFLDAYNYSQDDKLLPIATSEAPDFICQRADGSMIGIELTKIMRDPNTAFIDSLDYKDYMDGLTALDKIYEALEKKRGLASSKVILVMQLVDCPLAELILFLDEKLQNDFASYGFMEIWLADFTGVEAYGDIELFCIHPFERWGYYQRPYPDRKPYG
ncbi:MAG: hypothetical protein ABIB41_03500 [Nitrospirota bacterium]